MAEEHELDSYVIRLDEMVETLESENKRLRAFAAAVMAIAWECGDLDGGAAQDLALQHGVIVEVPFDPKKHHGIGAEDVEPGDPWYVLAWSEKAR